MKVGILTHYDVNNQGAQLQMYALYNQLILMGHHPCILTYLKNYDFVPQEKLKNQVSLRSIPYYIRNYVIKQGIALSIFNAKKYMVNKQFRTKQFIFEDYAASNAESVVIGSDEVFSIPMGVNMMMFGHGLLTNKIFAYAPSFGQTDMGMLEKHHCKELIISGLNTFTAISARDEHTVNMIKALTGKVPQIVCDPVLLYDFSNTPKKIKLIKEKYLLVYSYDRWMVEPNEIESIKQYAKMNGMITVSAGTYHKWCDRNIVCNCLEWLEYFRNADAVVTDTFHGLVMSIVTNRPMAVYVRGLNVNKVTDLLRRTNLNKQRIDIISVDELNRAFKTEIDFNEVNSAVNEMRGTSTEYLTNTLALCTR